MSDIFRLPAVCILHSSISIFIQSWKFRLFKPIALFKPRSAELVVGMESFRRKFLLFVQFQAAAHNNQVLLMHSKHGAGKDMIASSRKPDPVYFLLHPRSDLPRVGLPPTRASAVTGSVSSTREATSNAHAHVQNGGRYYMPAVARERSRCAKSSPRVAVPPRPRTRMPLMYSLPVQHLKELASHVAPGAALGAVMEVKSMQLPRLYNLLMTDELPLLLAINPSLSVRLLRHESTIMASEACVVHFLSQSDLRSQSPASIRSSRGEEEILSSSMQLPELVPKLLKHSSNSRESAYPYSIFEPTAGVVISMLSPPLSPSNRRSVDKEIGSMARALASRTSPTGAFGMASRILQDPSCKTTLTSPKVSGSETWSEAFQTLLEAVLRDGEDMSVLLPYETIRTHYRKLCWRLDAVKTPRLVVINVNSDDNVMVERRFSSKGESTKPVETARLTGLRNWSQGIFGDPVLSSCFDDPSDEFIEGWQDGGEEVIEDEENMNGRSLLYQCYRAVVMIVTEYYRPQTDSKRELNGRRRLTSALKELNEMFNDEDETIKRVRSLSIADITRSPKRHKLSEV
ncbi:hypothetical protein LZ554_003814 [Drepanopeziza brunnea f. sp. 'monogermtubi']|nr:hypothetical protein LZ554_003814 [Drepanopeziza brunnea f. sp. 'monogermtubi']